MAVIEYSEYVEARDSTTPLGIDLIVIVQGGEAFKITVGQLQTLLVGTPVVSVSTAGSTITLPFGDGLDSYQRGFIGSASFSTPKTIALGSATNANHFTFIFEITDVAATLTFPASFKSGDSRYNNPTPLMFTSDEIGIFKVTGDKYSTSWILEFSTLPAV